MAQVQGHVVIRFLMEHDQKWWGYFLYNHGVLVAAALALFSNPYWSSFVLADLFVESEEGKAVYPHYPLLACWQPPTLVSFLHPLTLKYVCTNMGGAGTDQKVATHRKPSYDPLPHAVSKVLISITCTNLVGLWVQGCRRSRLSGQAEYQDFWLVRLRWLC